MSESPFERLQMWLKCASDREFRADWVAEKTQWDISMGDDKARTWQVCQDFGECINAALRDLERQGMCKVNDPMVRLQEWLEDKKFDRNFEAVWCGDDGWNMKLKDGEWDAYWQCLDLSNGVREMLDEWDRPFLLLADWLLESSRHSVTYSKASDGAMQVTLSEDDGPSVFGVGDTTRAAIVDALSKWKEEAV